MNSSPSPPLRWFQFSLKTLFVFMLVVAAFFGGWSIAQRRADVEIQKAQEAANTARQQADQARFELDLERERSRPQIPCHPGCFPAGTLVRVPGGVKPIEQIAQGDEVAVVDANGKVTSRRVSGLFNTPNRLVTVQTDAGSLETTETQPICLESGETRSAGELKPGDKIWRWDGAKRTAVAVQRMSIGRETTVFNLVLGEPTVFIAGDFLVRSKPPAELVLP